MGFHEEIFDTLNDWSERYRDGLPEEFGFSRRDGLAEAGEKLRQHREAGRSAVRSAGGPGADEPPPFPAEALEPLAKFPDVIGAVLFNIARTGFKNGRRMRWVWKPGYDFEVNVSQERGGSVTIVVTTPYPDEMHDFDPERHSPRRR